ncbi:MAG TPA: HAMP domain-containing sensor histidine kinase [Myxococcales bacterium]|nr:HAMP domain-containing sensor histidine kinase [Myxococcales bacterium]
MAWAIGVAALSLVGPLAAMFALWRGAQLSLERVLDARLRGAGESAALLLQERAEATQATLPALMRTHHLDGAYLLDRRLTVLADATGPAGGRADLLRVDADRVAAAFSGEATVASTYALGEVVVATGYFPLREPSGQVSAVLALEAGRAFADPGPWLSRALAVGVLGALGAAAAIGVIGRRALQGQAAAVRADAFAKVAAMAAHEIRNPLGVIRGTVELMRGRLQGTLTPRDAEALADVLGEVERLKRLTEDLTDLSQDRPLSVEDVDVAQVLEEAARAAERSHPQVKVKVESGGALPQVRGDPARLRQVFANLLANAAQAQGEGEVEVRAAREGGFVQVLVRDRGPGVPPGARGRLFDPFFTTKAQGSGLGLVISRRLVERHGGTLRLVDGGGPGATFEVRLSAGSDDGARAGRG